jgi:hypothetical protein
VIQLVVIKPGCIRLHSKEVVVSALKSPRAARIVVVGAGF